MGLIKLELEFECLLFFRKKTYGLYMASCSINVKTYFKNNLSSAYRILLRLSSASCQMHLFVEIIFTSSNQGGCTLLFYKQS